MLFIGRFFILGSGSRFFDGLNSFGRAIEGVTSAAGNLADAGANITIALSDIAVGSVSVASSAMDEALHGVDLLNVTIDRTSSKAVAASGSSFSVWIRAGGDGNLPVDHLGWYANIVASVSRPVPFLTDVAERLSVNGFFYRATVRCRLRADGSVAAVLMLVNASFEPQWVNPAWQLVGFHIGFATNRIVSEFRKTFDSLPAMDKSLTALDEMPVLSKKSWKRSEVGHNMAATSSLSFDF